MPITVTYKTSALAKGGREGLASILDGSLALKLSTPKEFGGAGGDGTNPEQLFAMGYAACFLSALKHVAGIEKIRIDPESTVKSTVGIGPSGGGAFGLEVSLEISLPGIESEKAEDLVNKAHHACPYSNATRGNVDVKLFVA